MFKNPNHQDPRLAAIITAIETSAKPILSDEFVEKDWDAQDGQQILDNIVIGLRIFDMLLPVLVSHVVAEFRKQEKAKESK